MFNMGLDTGVERWKQAGTSIGVPLGKAGLFVLLSPFIGAVAFAGVAILFLVLGWAIYGVVAWFTVFLWTLSLLLGFPLYGSSPPTGAFIVAFSAATVCHIWSLCLISDWFSNH